MAFRILEEHPKQGEQPSPYSKEYFITTRDGAKLASDVYIPNGDETNKYPTIMSRTPYDKRSRYTALRYEAEYFVSRGYAFVAQDVRGKFRSTGDTEPYAYDVADGYDSVEWIVQQPWSDGKVGVTGASYYGFTVWAAVASGHPAIKAAVPVVTGIQMGSRHVATQWELDVPSLISLKDLLQIWTNNKGYLAELDYGQPLETIVREAAEVIGPSIGANHLIERSKRTGWYNPYGERHPYHTTSIPILHWAGWYDPGLCPAGMKDWRHFQSTAQRNLHYLHVGSTDHSGYKLENVGGGDEKNPYKSEETIRIKIEEEHGDVADFFDEHIRNQPPATPRPRTKWHIGHDGWRETADFPPPSKPVTFSLGATGSSATGGSVHALGTSPPADATQLRWTHDPRAPVPSTTDIEAIWYLLAEYPDEKALQDRKDVLTFRTEPFRKPFTFVGQPEWTGKVSFSSDSAHLFAKLQDVYPDGTTRPISWGRMVITKKTAADTIKIPMDDNAYKVQEGHCLQFQLAASDFPYYLPHPGTEDNPYLASARKSTIDLGLTVGGVDGSKLVLPSFE